MRRSRIGRRPLDSTEVRLRLRRLPRHLRRNTRSLAGWLKNKRLSMASRWIRSKVVRKGPVPRDVAIEDIWDLIHYRCPLSKLEARVLIHRYVLGKGERELAQEWGVSWRRLNRATWRMKLKLRGQLEAIRRLPRS